MISMLEQTRDPEFRSSFTYISFNCDELQIILDPHILRLSMKPIIYLLLAFDLNVQYFFCPGPLWPPLL